VAPPRHAPRRRRTDDDRQLAIRIWGYDPERDKEILFEVIRRIARVRPQVRFAAIAAVVLGVLAIADIVGWQWANAIGRQQIAVTVGSEIVFLAIVYLVIEGMIERSNNRRWATTVGPLVRGLSAQTALTDSVFRRALRDLSDEREWKHFRLLADGMAHDVRSSQPVLTATTDLTAIWVELLQISNAYSRWAEAPTAADFRPALENPLFQQNAQSVRQRVLKIVDKINDEYAEGVT
jgi:hypothetical protein